MLLSPKTLVKVLLLSPILESQKAYEKKQNTSGKKASAQGLGSFKTLSEVNPRIGEKLLGTRLGQFCSWEAFNPHAE